MGEDENTEGETQRSIIMMPTFQHNSAMATPHNNKSLHAFRRSRRRLKMQQQPVKQEVMMKEEIGGGGGCALDEKRGEEGGKKEEEEEEEEEDGREEIERKIHALQKIVPGGESFGVDKLFDETAGYIVALQHQVKTLRALAGFFEKLDKEKTMLGG